MLTEDWNKLVAELRWRAKRAEGKSSTPLQELTTTSNIANISQDVKGKNNSLTATARSGSLNVGVSMKKYTESKLTKLLKERKRKYDKLLANLELAYSQKLIKHSEYIIQKTALLERLNGKRGEVVDLAERRREKQKND